MKINLLTIGVLVCDNDADLLPEFLSRVDSRVKVPHEIVVWDNTVEKSLPPLPDSVRVISRGMGEWKENVRQFEGRKGIAANAKGDWVWYVDPDDDVLEVGAEAVSPLDDGLDAIVFDYLRDGWPVKIGASIGSAARTVSFADGRKAMGLHGGLWNKWIAAAALREAFAAVDGAARISFMEDDLLQMLLLRSPRRVQSAGFPIYRYSESESTGGSKVIRDGGEMARYAAGARDVISIIQRVFGDKTAALLNWECGGDISALVTDRLAARLARAMRSSDADAAKVAELAAPLKGEVSAREVMTALQGRRRDVPSPRLAEWAKKEDMARDALFGVPPFERSAPRAVCFMLSLKCNLHCPYCCQLGEHRSARRDYWSDDDIFGRFDHALSRIESFGYKFTPSVVGGEPTLFSDSLVHRMLDRLKDYNEICVPTNGTNRDSAWYSDPRCFFRTHITDWETATESFPPATGHDVPLIVVTHQTVRLLERYLDINKRDDLIVSPATSAGEMDCDDDDVARIKELVDAHGIDFGVNNRRGYAEGAALSTLPVCERRNLTWQVNLLGEETTASSCCKGDGAGYIPIDEWTPDCPPDCSRCTVCTK